MPLCTQYDKYGALKQNLRRNENKTNELANICTQNSHHIFFSKEKYSKPPHATPKACLL